MFLPATRPELDNLGWEQPDIILVTGDSYIDSPFIGTAVIGKVLNHAGYRVGVIAQPDIHSGKDICRLGEPRLFWGVSGGSVDSMVANYTTLKKKRKSDDYTPGGINNRRPDRATIVYTNLIKRHFKNTRPIVLGGIEASLRRIAHYDFWSDRVRSSILFDAKADYLLYGMAEKAVLQLANALKDGTDVRNIRGLCYIAGEGDSIQKRDEYPELPSYESVEKDNH
ncbi:MAG: YgiQ family radical SAM protein, partial [bacterium]|nr:YgiQ family radical SAM protein [bacterium]